MRKAKIAFLFVVIITSYSCTVMVEIPAPSIIPSTQKIPGNAYDQGALVQIMSTCQKALAVGGYGFSRGTGYLITPNGLIQTANHVISECELHVVRISQEPAKLYLAKKISGDKLWDIGRLQIVSETIMTEVAADLFLDDILPQDVSRVEVLVEPVPSNGNPMPYTAIQGKKIIIEILTRPFKGKLPYLQVTDSKYPIGKEVIIEGYARGKHYVCFQGTVVDNSYFKKQYSGWIMRWNGWVQSFFGTRVGCQIKCLEFLFLKKDAYCILIDQGQETGVFAGCSGGTVTVDGKVIATIVSADSTAHKGTVLIAAPIEIKTKLEDS